MAARAENRQKLPHPIITKVRQIAPNQIYIKYDRRTDLASATNVSNYWIRSNMEHPISGVATEGMDWALTESNALRPDTSKITPFDDSKKRFIITFKVDIVPSLVHVVLPCFVNLEGHTGFDGVNWGPFSRNMFIGMETKR